MIPQDGPHRRLTLDKAVPHGVYDIATNAGWVSVGMNPDTAAFAVEAIRRWWHELGDARYPAATKLLITAGCGAIKGALVRPWKRELQVLANEFGIGITLSHLPPCTSKWNRIVPHPFAFITQVQPAARRYSICARASNAAAFLG